MELHTVQWRIQEFIHVCGGAGQCACEACTKNFTTTPILSTTPTNFKPSHPLRCALLRTELTCAADGIQDVMLSGY